MLFLNYEIPCPSGRGWSYYIKEFEFLFIFGGRGWLYNELVIIFRSFVNLGLPIAAIFLGNLLFPVHCMLEEINSMYIVCIINKNEYYKRLSKTINGFLLKKITVFGTWSQDINIPTLARLPPPFLHKCINGFQTSN